MTFRYKNKDNATFIVKIINSSDGKEIDVNAMDSASNDKIYTATISIGHLDVTSKDKSKLDNLDTWVSSKEGGIVTEQYIVNIFDKISGKKEKKEEKKKNTSGASD